MAVEINEELLVEATQIARPVIAGILQNWHDVEDCLQDACVSAIEHADSFRGACKFSTWFTFIARNIALMKIRRGKNALGRAMKHVEDLDGLACRRLNPEQIFLAKNQNARLVDAVLDLAPVNRTEILLWATDMHQLNSGNTNKARRFRAKAALREALR